MKLFKKEKQEEQKLTYRFRSEEELKLYKQEREQEREQKEKEKRQLLKKFELVYKIDKDFVKIDGFEHEGIIWSDGNYPQQYAVYKEYIENVYLQSSTYMEDISTIKNIPVENIHIKKINLLDFVKIEGDDLIFGLLVELE